MSHSYSLKNLPAPVQLLIRPMLFISLGLHSLLLLVPLSPEKNPILAKQEEDTVKITQLPTSAGKPSAKPASKPPSQAKPSRATSSPRSVATSKPQSAGTAQSSSTNEQSNSGDQANTDGQSNDPFADFPHYPSAQSGAGSCSGKPGCWQAAAELAPVAAHFEKQLPAKKYEVQNSTDEPDKKIYQVSKGGQSRYLSSIAVAEGTVYVLGTAPINSLEDILRAAVVPNELYPVLGELGGESAEDTDFEDPDNFYAKLSREDQGGSVLIPELRPGVDGNPQKISGKTPDQVYSDLQSKLQSSGLSVLEAKPHGGGALYRVQKGKALGYLNLVPTKDRKGTIVVVWARSPN